VKGRWFKTTALARVLVAPMKNIQKFLKDSISKKDEAEMADDTHESKDYYMIVTDGIEKYGRTLIKIVVKESNIYGDVTEGCALALRHVEEIANFNSSLFRGLVTCFLKNSIFEGTAIVRWALGDFGEAMTGDVVPRWWEFTLDALQISNHATTADESMIVDGSEAEAEAEAFAISARLKILTYTVRRVCSLLTTNNQKRLDPVQVDLLEGMKSVAFRAKRLDCSGATIVPLIDLCSGCEGSTAAELLKSSLLQP